MLSKELFMSMWVHNEDEANPRYFVLWHEFEENGKWEGFKVEVAHVYMHGDEEFWTWRAFSTFASPISASCDLQGSTASMLDAYETLSEKGWLR